MPERSWEATKQYVYERAQGCCEYCRTCDANTGQTMHVEHILPNGDNDPENLCLACPNCNLSKAAAVIVVDALTSSSVSLFNPRRQHWSEHFAWIDNYTNTYGAGKAKMDESRSASPNRLIANATLLSSTT